ncbi:Exodeoxyribonuclease VII small subunit [Sphingomonas sp. YR710]|jgi:exodeoxyribonuclease VII small subunit|uniref:exodeoxyribonuclease VII small subunit n=1 Tax=Sphingomonas sp. YR710 TaxID=1882773 RepID=UPI00088EE50B|nr:exodeoxyribonuclease VII small subunit [Sphingomonas sp. YR710]SDD35113.1 Exodeoxyribonuclease VII small subunit [Sphingomonas sp. YR710]
MEDVPAPVAELSFEDALKKLEAIVRRLESGDVPLDQSIDLYAEGDALRRQCEERLKSAQMRIDKIVLNADGKPAATEPFDVG